MNRRGRSAGSVSSGTVDAVTTMPAVQNPHWNPPASTNRCCTGCRSSGVPSPATVVTARPSARSAGNTHECTGVSSTSTEHAPQSPVSQPFLTSVCPTPRSRVRRHCPGAGDVSVSTP